MAEFIDASKYADAHSKIVEHIRRMTSIDLNKYRDGNGASPFTTSYWEKGGPWVAVDWKSIPRVEKGYILSLQSIKVEAGGAWISYISWRDAEDWATEDWSAEFERDREDDNGSD